MKEGYSPSEIKAAIKALGFPDIRFLNKNQIDAVFNCIHSIRDSRGLDEDSPTDVQLKVFSMENAVIIFKTMYDGKNYFPPDPMSDILSFAKEIEAYINDSRSLDKKEVL